jgi:isopenicillin N synthase-like dioxygenase
VPAEHQVRPSPLHGKNPWPDNRPTFSRALKTYATHMEALGTSIMRGLALGLGLQETFFEGQYRGQPYWVMRVIHYPPLPEHSTMEGSSAGNFLRSTVDRALTGLHHFLCLFCC